MCVFVWVEGVSECHGVCVCVREREREREAARSFSCLGHGVTERERETFSR